MKDKALIEEKAKTLKELTAGFCAEKLDDEYKELCAKMIQKLSRKRDVPFMSGRLEIWAAAIIYAIGQINFLFDKSFMPYTTPDEICVFYDQSKSTVGQKAKLIREMLKLNIYDAEFSTRMMKEDNPYDGMMEINGIILPKSSFPPDVRRE